MDSLIKLKIKIESICRYLDPLGFLMIIHIYWKLMHIKYKNKVQCIVQNLNW